MALKKCAGCGIQFEGDMKFCTRCGGKLEDVEGSTVPEKSETGSGDGVQQRGTDAVNENPPINSCAKPEIKPGRGRVIKLDGKIVTLGMTDGTVSEIPLADLDFKVKIGDEIDIFANNGKTIYAKVTPKEDIMVVQDKGTNKLIYFLLAFFLGTMGVHNFYSGNIVIGIIWLIVFGICCLLTLTGIGAFISVPILGLLEIIALIQAIVYVIK